MLTDAQRKEYATQGFTLARGVLGPEQVEIYLARAREFALGKIPPGSEKMVVKEVRLPLRAAR